MAAGETIWVWKADPKGTAESIPYEAPYETLED